MSPGSSFLPILEEEKLVGFRPPRLQLSSEVNLFSPPSSGTHELIAAALRSVPRAEAPQNPPRCSPSSSSLTSARDHTGARYQHFFPFYSLVKSELQKI